MEGELLKLVVSNWGKESVGEIRLRADAAFPKVQKYKRDYVLGSIINALEFYPRYPDEVMDGFMKAYLDDTSIGRNVEASQYMMGRLFQQSIINATLGQTELCNRGSASDRPENVFLKLSDYEDIQCYFRTTRLMWNNMLKYDELGLEMDHFSGTRPAGLHTVLTGRYELFERITSTTYDSVLSNPDENHYKTDDKELEKIMFNAVRVHYPGSKNIFLDICKSVEKIRGKHVYAWSNASDPYKAMGELRQLYEASRQDKRYIPHFYWAYVIVSPSTRGSAAIADMFRGHLDLHHYFVEKKDSTKSEYMAAFFVHVSIDEKWPVKPVKKEYFQLDAIALGCKLVDFQASYEHLLDTS